MSEICGMVPFINSSHPDQFYRLFISLFIHVGSVLSTSLVFALYFAAVLWCVCIQHVKKRDQNVFCNIFDKTQAILTNFGTLFPE